MDNNNKMKAKLVKLLSLFNDRPNTLAHLLLCHGVLTESFKKRLEESPITDKPKKFEDFQKMLDYYQQLFEPKISNGKKDNHDWNIELIIAITEQRYEDAAKIRDYMTKNKIKFKL